MKKFLVLYQSSVSAAEQMAKATPAQAKAGMDAWMAWSKKAGGGIVDLGSPTNHTATATTTGTSTGGNLPIGGYSVLQAESQAALEALLKGHPHFMAPGASIAILECMPIPGM